MIIPNVINIIFCIQITIAVTTNNIIRSFETAYPSDTFLVYKFPEPGGTAWFHGTLLLRAKLTDNDWLRVYKLAASAGSIMESDEIKAQAFPFIYDTKSETDAEKRRDSLRHSLENIFPEHNVNVFIFSKSWTRSHTNIKGAVSFIDGYGSEVDIVLS